MTPNGTPTSTETRILLVDDNVDASLIVSLGLQQKGFTVQRGDSGPQALSIAAVWAPQAILLDISMPGMDGYETCRLLREQPGGPALAILALTGYEGADAQQRSEEAGFDGHLVKPVDLISLPGILLEVIEKKKTSAPLE
jgi:two-component system CheB/CheR fusion protein